MNADRFSDLLDIHKKLKIGPDASEELGNKHRDPRILYFRCVFNLGVFCILFRKLNVSKLRWARSRYVYTIMPQNICWIIV